MKLFSGPRLLPAHAVPPGALNELLLANQVASVFVAEHVARFRAVSLDQPPPVVGITRSSTAGSGRRSLGVELDGACWVGNNVVPVALGQEGIALVAHYLVTSRATRTSFFGPQREVLGLWHRLEHQWADPFAVREDQPLLTAKAESEYAPHPEVRLARSEDFADVLPASAQMFAEEVGYAPDLRQGSSYVRRVAQLIDQCRTYVVVRDSAVVFKADIGAAAGKVCQIQGVWIAPELRGQRLSSPFLAAVVESVRRRWPMVSLYVNSYNVPALRSYHRVGFRQVGTFATVLF
ncbi:MAG: GNAT family N-acetyltransferase [Kocuria sp.]|nr:GNAT family N-acetyltransferase [Kocuria sp.]